MTAEPATRVLKAEPAAIVAAAACLAAGGLVAFPTETVYGLGADASNGEAVARLYAAKGRPRFNPLIAHIGSLEAARRLGRFDATAETLAAAFWPGPLTLVLPKRPDAGVADLALAGLDSVAVRVPAHPVARALLAAFDGPVVAPSANRSGHVSPTDAAHVLADLRGRIDMVLDGGPCPVGLEFDHRRLSRRRRPCCGPAGCRARRSSTCSAERSAVAKSDDETPLAPGMLASHYAPKAQAAARRRDGRARRGAARLRAGAGRPTLNLSPRGDLIEAAANLFSHLRALDASGAKRIAVMPVPHEGLGEAINDRLKRAAAPKTGTE